MTSMIRSSEPRWAAGNNRVAPARQSLPSISEVISGARPGQYPPHHTSMPPQPNSGGLPSPFAPPSRQYPDSDKHSHSPQPLHPVLSTSRRDTIPAFADSPRPTFSGRPGLPPVTDRRLTPPGKPDGPAHGPVPQDHRSVSGGYPQPPAPTSDSYQPVHMPPGQLPLPGYPNSPRHEKYDALRSRAHGEPSPYDRSRYEAPPRRYGNWTYQDFFSRMESHSRTVFNFAEGYGRTAQEQNGPPSAERLPSEREVDEMLANVDSIKCSLEQVRHIVQLAEHANDSTMAQSYNENHDVTMYNDGIPARYPSKKGKKRRGRAAPPGRCHSCSRIDTPEWRSGPDGPRTLCNACGLHYAKLMRQRKLYARSLRAKTEERK